MATCTSTRRSTFREWTGGAIDIDVDAERWLSGIADIDIGIFDSVDDGDGRRTRMRIGYRKAGGKLASFREEYLKKEITESEAGEDAGDRVGETK